MHRRVKESYDTRKKKDISTLANVKTRDISILIIDTNSDISTSANDKPETSLVYTD